MKKLHYDVVQPELYNLLVKLMKKDYLNNFYLVGGTSLAFQIGHRQSEDIDLFSNYPDNDYGLIKEEIGKMSTELNSVFKNSLISKIDNIKVDIIQYNYPWLDAPLEIDGLRMAGLKDIAAMKLSAITQGGSKKDFWDLFFLMKIFDINQMFEFYIAKYNQKQIGHVLKSLVYFVDAESQNDPVPIIPAKWKEIKSAITLASKKVIYN